MSAQMITVSSNTWHCLAHYCSYRHFAQENQSKQMLSRVGGGTTTSNKKNLPILGHAPQRHQEDPAFSQTYRAHQV